jgi:hypothetical protein
MRSWASLIQISHGREALVLERRALEVDLGAEALGAISPTAELKPPAPQSVIAREQVLVARSAAPRPWTLRSVIGSPICTAPELTSRSRCAVRAS